MQQISGTQQQVAAKSQVLAAFLGGLSGAARAYGLVVLAGRLVSQCEAQVALNHAFCFPLAEVVAAVIGRGGQAGLLPVLLAALHQVCFWILLCSWITCLSLLCLSQACVLTVPKCFVHRAGGDSCAYLRRMGYREQAAGAWESSDDFAGRMCGYMHFYAAFLQSEHPGHAHGIEHAWAFVARSILPLPSRRHNSRQIDDSVILQMQVSEPPARQPRHCDGAACLSGHGRLSHAQRLQVLLCASW